MSEACGLLLEVGDLIILHGRISAADVGCGQQDFVVEQLIFSSKGSWLQNTHREDSVGSHPRAQNNVVFMLQVMCQ